MNLKPPAIREITETQELALTIFCIYSVIESKMWFSGMRETMVRQPGTFKDILIFNMGNLNNVFLYGAVIDALLSYFVRSRIIRASVVLILAIVVSVIVEYHDPLDLIGSAVGFLLYAIYNYGTKEL